MSEESHGVVELAVPLPVNCVVVAIQADKVPVIIGEAYIVTVSVAVQPLVSVYVISDVPLVNPLTNPVLSTVATVLSEEAHGIIALAVLLPVNCVLAPVHADKVPVNDVVGLTVSW